MNKPYSIKVFLPGGDPDGLRTIEKSNWSGAGIVIPRALMGEAKSRRELTRTGVYVLVGPPEESGLPRVYVGEGDPIKPRLEQHAAKKDFWTSCIAFTSKDENLNKAHVQYIESRLITFAAKAKRCVLDNGNAPALPSLSEADAADCHRAVQNQPLVGDSKPASLRCGFHNSYGCWIKRFGSRINEPGTAASPSSRPRRSTVPSTWRCSPRAGMATASP
jgi:hypothetical protein